MAIAPNDEKEDGFIIQHRFIHYLTSELALRFFIIIIIVTVCGYSFQNIQLKKYVIKPSPRISLATATTALQEE